MSRLRVFIAVNPGKAIRSRCAMLQETLARSAERVRWEKPENIHATLLFLGDVIDRDLPALCEAVSGVCARIEPFTVDVEGVGCFPNLQRPRTIWAGIGTGAAELIGLHDALEKPLIELGIYRREERQFKPHLTLGRLKGDGMSYQLTMALTKQQQWHGGEVAIDEVLVMSSDLTPDGPIYSVVSTAKLPRHASGTSE
jgi:RNA 2',3'-cyclic 3'-phosphodiesterase